MKAACACNVNCTTRRGGGIRKPNSTHSMSPMYLACMEGQLLVCQWLFEVGAAEDITKVDKLGTTPITMLVACGGGRLPISRWFFEVGAKGDITNLTRTAALPYGLLAGRAACRSASGCAR